MCQNTIVYVTDKRQQYLRDYLPGKNWQGELPEKTSIKYFVLPTPVSKLDNYPDESRRLKEWIQNSRGVITVFGGRFNSEWQSFLEENQVAYVDLMEDEKVAQENAKITAEATVSEILQHSLYALRGEKVIVTGYGKCGKEIAGLLQRMGAKVTVLARSSSARKAAKADGHNANDFSYGPEEAYGSRIFVNTVPAKVITESIIKEMHPDSFVVDIASKPGGCDLEAIENYGIKYKMALGLPGIYTPKSSAKILAEAIKRHTFFEYKERENSSWIYQIVL